jgi:hypothetical protein
MERASQASAPPGLKAVQVHSPFEVAGAGKRSVDKEIRRTEYGLLSTAVMTAKDNGEW